MSGKRILVMDHDPKFRKALSAAAAEQGYQVTTAADLPTAQKAVEGAPMSLAVIDLALPDLDVGALISALHERQTELPCLVQTTQATIPLAAAVAQLPHVDLVARPLPIPQLLEQLARHAHDHEDEVHQQAEDHIQDIMKRRGW